ncbi:class I SAM-dependent methyltransferase [bacterium]|nr:MAG: class I SAM-dependent methyltransferase [bacterium]
MKLESFKQFLDYQLLDTGDGYRLEQWGPVRLQRPDPQAIWSKSLPALEWDKASAVFVGSGERGKWSKKNSVPQKWEIYFKPDVKLVAKLTPFKHTGIFAEQAANWEWMTEVVQEATRQGRQLKILNLFAYTGGASMVLTRVGHKVTHVDASKPSIGWAKENQLANKFAEDSIRWILDDAAKFAERELKRGEKYDGVIMDPPAFGHSPSGKTWKFNRDLPKLLETCVSLLSDDAKFLLINGYATNSSALSLNNILEDKISKLGGKIEFGELCLEHKIKTASNDAGGRTISTGIFARWQN